MSSLQGCRRPGRSWQEELEKVIRGNRIKSAAVFVGKNGIGPWQNAEMQAFLSKFYEKGLPVIPVLLPNASEVPVLPFTLEQLTWVDMRKDKTKAIKRLIWGIKGD